MKKTKRSILSLSITALCLTTVIPASAEEQGMNLTVANRRDILHGPEFTDVNTIPPELLAPGYYSDEEIIRIPIDYLDPHHPDTIRTVYDAAGTVESGNGKVRAFAIPAAAAGIYLIPGIGEVAITATGGLIIAGATVAAGSWIYNKVSTYLSKKNAEGAAADIPKRLKKSGMQVDLSKFKDKNGRTPANKSSGTFSNGKWRITRDTTGHLGYDGTKKAWKIGDPTRVGSLNKNGYIIDK